MAKNERPWHELNIAHTEFIEKRDMNGSPSTEVRYIKCCCHCRNPFWARRVDALACSPSHAVSVSRYIEKHGEPAQKFSKAELQEAKIKAMGKKTETDGEAPPKIDRERAKRMADFRRKADQDDEPAQELGMGAAPHDHYRHARNIIINYYNRHGFKKIEALHEMAADKERSYYSLIVDVGFIDARTEENLVAVEIVRNFSTDILKPGSLLNSGFREVLVYNYITGQWGRHTPEGDYSSSQSQVLGIDLAEYIDLPK